MILREMTKSDLAKVLKIERESFSDPWTENMFQDLFDSSQYKNYVAEENGQILGYMSVIATFYLFEVINIAVQSESRRLGVASLLMEKVISLAKEFSVERVFLEVRGSNLPAQNLYRKFGFKQDGVRKGYYQDGEDALLMSLSL